MKKGQKRADLDMEVCIFFCFGSAIWSLSQKLFFLENMCTTNSALQMSQNCVFIWFQAIYTIRYDSPHFRIPFTC